MTLLLQPLSGKDQVTSFTDKALDTVCVEINGTGIRRMDINDFIAELGGTLGDQLPDLDAVDGLASINFADAITNEVRWVLSVADFFIWQPTMTAATAAGYSHTVEPADKASPGVAAGFWVRNGSKINDTAALVSGATETLEWIPDTQWTLVNNEVGGIALTINSVPESNKFYYIKITTNGNPLTLSNVDIEDGVYVSTETTMVLQFYKANGLLIGNWVPKVTA